MLSSISHKKLPKISTSPENGMLPSLFGTDGIRGTVNTGLFTPKELINLGHAIGTWAVTSYGPNPRILLANDTRESCEMVKSALKTGMLAHSVIMHDAQVLPTPALCKIIQKTGSFNCGIMITASHNEAQDNGIKIIDTQHGKLSSQAEQNISNYFHTQKLEQSYTITGSYTEFTIGKEIYSTSITEQFPKNFLHNTHAVLDCAHGATYELAPHIFKLCGARVTLINATPNGTNINKQCGSTHPENLRDTVLATNADVGFAFDGDGDRIVAVNKYGKFLEGDALLALLTTHPLYKKESNIVGTIMTNQGLEAYLNQQNKQLLRTPVGDKHIAAELKKNNLQLGGEPSGHIILRNHLNMGDGIFTALSILETMLLTQNMNMKTFDLYPNILVNIPVSTKKDLTKQPLAQLIKKHEAQLPNGRLVIRYSGTEPLLRIMVESEDAQGAYRISEALSKALKKELST